MPSGIFPVPEFRPVPARARPTRSTRRRLDEELARGADPDTSPELRLRAAQLRSRSERSRLANALVEALGDARGPNLGAFRLKTRRQHAVIREYADDLRALVDRLRDDQPVDVRGAAMTARLVDNRASILHRNGGQHMQHEIRAARFALDAPGPTAQHLPAAA
ncbi:MAG: hypothetical protein ACREX8_05945 [Gammaproteobacteria bacterium]